MGGGFGGAAVLAGAIALAGSEAVAATACPNNPNALSTSRILTLNPAEMPRLGAHDYGRTLPLADREVVLTFDDGPMAPYTEAVLNTLAEHCVKAVFFMVGRNARHHPELARRVLAAGHTIGTHTQNHPLRPMNAAQTVREVSTGIASVRTALGSPAAVAPFFRFPGLHHTSHGERYLRLLGIAAWSIDVDSHDWKRNTPDGVLHNILSRLEAKGRGIVLMHDVQAKTAVLLPRLLAELKQRGYRVVHVVPSGPQPPAPPDLIAERQPGPTSLPSPTKETTGIRSAPQAPRQIHWPVMITAQQPGYIAPASATGNPTHIAARPGPDYIQPIIDNVTPKRPAQVTRTKSEARTSAKPEIRRASAKSEPRRIATKPDLLAIFRW